MTETQMRDWLRTAIADDDNRRTSVYSAARDLLDTLERTPAAAAGQDAGATAALDQTLLDGMARLREIDPTGAAVAAALTPPTWWIVTGRLHGADEDDIWILDGADAATKDDAIRLAEAEAREDAHVGDGDYVPDPETDVDPFYLNYVVQVESERKPRLVTNNASGWTS